MTRKRREAGLYERIRDLLATYKPGEPHYFSKESLAVQLKARQHEVAEVLARLNREGVVSQAVHVSCPDRGFGGKWKCWHPDVYYIREREVQP